MKKSILLTIIASVVLIAFASLVSASVGVSLFYEDTNFPAYTIDDGETTSFLVSSSGYLESYIVTDVDLLDADGNKLEDLIDATTYADGNSVSYYLWKDLTPALYTGPGIYKIKATVTGSLGGQPATSELTLEVLEVDNTNPIVSITNPVNGVTYTSHRTSLTFTASDANLQSCEYSLNGGQRIAVSCSSGVSRTVGGISSVEGQNTWRVYATDSFGNSASDSVTFTVDTSIPGVDTTPPVITVVTPLEDAVYTSSQIDLDVYVNEEVQYLEYSLDGAENVAMNEIVPNEFEGTISNLENGGHTITFYTEDLAHNAAEKTVDFEVQVDDTTPPVITVICPQEGEDYDTGGIIIFEVELNEAGSVEYSLDGADRVSMTETGTLVFTSQELDLDEDDYTVTFYARDLAGNTAQITINFEIDEDKDDKKSSSSYDGSSYDFKLYEEQSNPRKSVIDLSDDEQIAKKLNWIQRLINWLVQLFGGESVY